MKNKKLIESLNLKPNQITKENNLRTFHVLGNPFQLVQNA